MEGGLVKQKFGGSAWESNPPKTLLMPPNGFEVREAHRDSSAPYPADRQSIHYPLNERNLMHLIQDYDADEDKCGGVKSKVSSFTGGSVEILAIGGLNQGLVALP